MSRNARIGLVGAAVVVAVAGFAIARPNDDDGGAGAPQTAPATETSDGGGATAADPEAERAPPPELELTWIRIRGGEVVGGPRDVAARNGDVVRIVVSSDAPDELHLHGYDLTEQAAPGQPARFRFDADLEGSFELESHAAEDAGRDPLVARLNVEPR